MTGSPVPPLTAAQLSMWAPTDVDAVLAGLDPAADPDAGPLDWTAPTRAPQAPRPTGALADRAATATYGAPFACAVRRDNVWGVQFHPEKSHHFGAMLLKNFAEI